MFAFSFVLFPRKDCLQRFELSGLTRDHAVTYTIAKNSYYHPRFKGIRSGKGYWKLLLWCVKLSRIQEPAQRNFTGREVEL